MADSQRSSQSLSSTLLLRLRRNEPTAWQRLVQLFGPTVYSRCRRAGLSPDDAADITQEVFRSVTIGLPSFRRDRPGDSFRGWLATIVRNRIADHFRRVGDRPQGRGGTEFRQRVENEPAPFEQPADAGAPRPDEDRGVVHRAAALVEGEFEPRTWQAFWRTAVEHAAPSDVAADLGISVNAVYKAKSRVLRRLRDELDGLLD